jgi:hypothetical protein
MKRSLFRLLALVGALSVASLAHADVYGRCYIYCSNGTTAGPYGSSSAGCCEDFQNLCGGYGAAYTVAGFYPYQTWVECYVE